MPRFRVDDQPPEFRAKLNDDYYEVLLNHDDNHLVSQFLNDVHDVRAELHFLAMKSAEGGHRVDPQLRDKVCEPN